MVGLATHDVVAERSSVAICGEGRIVNQGVKAFGASLSAKEGISDIPEESEGELQGASTHVIQIEVHPTVLAQEEVAQDVDPLDGELIAVVGFEEPWVFILNERPRVFYTP